MPKKKRTMCFYMRKVYSCGHWTWDLFSRQCRISSLLLRKCDDKHVESDQHAADLCPSCYLNDKRHSPIVDGKERVDEWFASEDRKQGMTRKSLEENLKMLDNSIQKAEQDLADMKNDRDKLLRYTREMS